MNSQITAFRTPFLLYNVFIIFQPTDVSRSRGGQRGLGGEYYQKIVATHDRRVAPLEKWRQDRG